VFAIPILAENPKKGKREFYNYFFFSLKYRAEPMMPRISPTSEAV
jgi:hypothetical protein